MNTENQFTVEKTRCAEIASAMLNNEIHLIEGVRMLCFSKLASCDPNNSFFVILRGIESETDVFPLGKVRDNWNSDALQQLDSELNSYLNKVSSSILHCCKEIVKLYS